MAILNENEKSFDKNEEVLEKVSGGTETSELSEFIIQIWTQDYGQPDGSFKYVCPDCGKVITGTNLGHFYDVVCAHFKTHLPDLGLDDGNLPLQPNPDYLG